MDVQFRISKKYIYLLSILLIIFAVAGITVLLLPSGLFPSKSIPCSSCGLINSDRKSQSNIISGIILKKYKRDGRYFIDVATKDAKKQPIVLYFTLRPSPARLLVTERDTDSENPDPQEKRYDGKDFYELLKEQQNWIFIFLTPSQHDIEKASKQIKDTQYLMCFKHHQNVVDYLKKPSLLGKVNLLIERLQSKCSVTLSSASR